MIHISWNSADTKMTENFGYPQMVAGLRESFSAGSNRSYEARMKNLEAIKLCLNTYYDEACEALHKVGFL